MESALECRRLAAEAHQRVARAWLQTARIRYGRQARDWEAAALAAEKVERMAREQDERAERARRASEYDARQAERAERQRLPIGGPE